MKDINCVFKFEKRTGPEKKESLARIQKLLIDNLDKGISEKCLNILNGDFERFSSCPGSYDKHQPWEGGYFDHLEQIFNYILKNYNKKIVDLLPEHEKYNIQDAFLVAFFHDIEKPFKYINPVKDFKNEYSLFYKDIDSAKLDNFNSPFDMFDKYVKIPEGIYFPSDKELFANKNGIEFTVKHRIAMHYVHGENYGTYHNSLRRQSPLGALVGNADRFSARHMFNIGFDLDGKMRRYFGRNLEGEGIGGYESLVNR